MRFDYSGQPLPRRRRQHLTAITFKNTSKAEIHHIVVFRKNAGVTESAKALLESQAEGKAVFVGVINDTKPGKSGAGLVNFTPGNYFVSCFLPVGGKENSQPHFMNGMYLEFSVK